MPVSSFVQTLSDFDIGDTTIDVLQKATEYDPGARLIVDFLEPSTYAGGTVPATIAGGATLTDLKAAPTALTLTSGSALTITTAGLKFTAASGQYFDISSVGKFPAGCLHFGFGGWLKTIDNSGDAQAFSAVAGYLSDTSPANCQWVIQRQRGTTTYTGIVGPASASIVCAVGEVAHLFYEVRVVAGVATVYAYKNGVLQSTSVPGALTGGVLPTPATSAYIGQTLPFTASCNVELGCFTLENFDVAGSRSATDYLARAYGDLVGRFS